MEKEYPLYPDEFKEWQNLYNQIFTLNGQESIIQNDGSKQLVLIPMMTFTLMSTMLQKIKYLPADCFNRMTIGKTPICALRPIDQISSSAMVKVAEIFRVIIDGVRKQQISSVTMIFYKKNNINTIYESYSLIIDYGVQLSDNETSTSVHMIAHMINQIEYMFNWNDSLPDDAELTFVMATLDQFNQDQQKLPEPFHFLKANVRQVYTENETNRLLGRLATPNGKIWLKFLPNVRQASGSTIESDDLPTRANMFVNPTPPPPPALATTAKDVPTAKSKRSVKITSPTATASPVASPKLKKAMKKLVSSKESSKIGKNLPQATTTSEIVSPKPKKKMGLLATVKSLITPSRHPAPLKSSTPNTGNLVLIQHTSTPKPGETASRITIGGREELPPLSAIYESSTPNPQRTSTTATQSSSMTPSTITATDISTAFTPTLSVNNNNNNSDVARAPTVRGQAALARKKIAAMQIQDNNEDENSKSDDGDDDESEDDEEQFKRLFTQRRSKRSKKTSTKRNEDFSQLSSISSASSNIEFVFTPPSARKRLTTDRTDADDLAAEHGTPPKTPRTARRNRNNDLATSGDGSMMMDTSDLPVNIDSPRLLRSVTKKLQEQALGKQQFVYEEERQNVDQSKIQQTSKATKDKNVNQERSSIALHYSMEESD